MRKPNVALILGVGAIAVLLASCRGGGAGAATPTPIPTLPEATASGTATPSPCPTATPTPTSPSSLGERADHLGSLLLCPVCLGETINESDAELAIQMRSIVRTQLEDGMAEADIIQFFVDLYGESVLAPSC